MRTALIPRETLTLMIGSVRPWFLCDDPHWNSIKCLCTEGDSRHVRWSGAKGRGSAENLWTNDEAKLLKNFDSREYKEPEATVTTPISQSLKSLKLRDHAHLRKSKEPEATVTTPTSQSLKSLKLR
ncbi:unnamed protein product [Boreogadus saida]